MAAGDSINGNTTWCKFDMGMMKEWIWVIRLQCVSSADELQG